MSIPDLDEELATLVPRLREHRHDIHQHPELGFEEVRTQQKVREWLSELGYDPRDSAQTGIVADLHPNRPGRTIALRADLDCLPIHETTDLPYRSVHAGRSHKCGHDGHTAILMGTAALLARHRDSIPGNVRLIFQPAEEGVRGGGAKVMVAEGVLEGVDEVYGLHNWPGYPLGELRVCAGSIMAQVHEFEIEAQGVGGHGSQPQTCRDPIVAASAAVVALQSVVARGLGAEGGGVLSVCTMHAGDANNVIPASAKMSGTIRTFSEAVTERVLERMREVIAGVGAAHGVPMELTLRAGYPVLVNDTTCAEAVTRVGASVLGPEACSARDLPMAGGEDFAYFARERPSAYFFLGAGRPGETTPGCHHPDFDFEDELIPTGVRMFMGLVSDRLNA